MSGAGEVKQELVIADDEFRASWSSPRRAVITISSSDSSSGDENGRSDVVVSNENRFQDSGGSGKKPKIEINEAVLPLRYHAPLPPVNRIESTAPVLGSGDETSNKESRCKQFWKAGDYVGRDGPHSQPACNGGMDHVRVHPRFLHSNATSHKWALGAFAELLDNSLDEVRTGCSYVKVDMLVNKKDNDSKMLLIQDNGGGMRPDKMRQCMSLGYSVKSKLADTIGQYGNGFKTSTMRLGADVIVFSCCQGKDDGSCPTKSVGLLSYTFLRSTGMEDIIVPMIDFEKREQEWKRVVRSSVDDWYRNLETIIKWSPYTSEDELLLQFQSLDEQGTRIVIYNLWEDDEGQLELDFDADRHDIQIRGVNRDNNKILLAQQFPNATHFLTYRHSLRSYAAILYSRVPPGFRIILRGKDVVHHNLVNDMIHKMQHTYRPQLIADGPPSGFDMVAVVTLGFVKDAEAYINIQGFSVYHKNRLIKPFWRVWNAAGSDGRGVIGVLEANFIEPAHDKQGFERTISLSRLETRLLKLQKDYWRDNCQKVGYAPRRKQLKNVDPEIMELALLNKRKSSMAGNDYFPHEPHGNPSPKSTTRGNSAGQSGHDCNNQTPQKSAPYFEEISSPVDCESDSQNESLLKSNPVHVKNQKEMASSPYPDSRVNILRKENAELKKRFLEVGEAKKADLLQLLQFERDNCKSLEAQLLKAEEKIMELDKEQEAVVQIFTEERNHRDIEEEKLRNRLRIASTTIQDLAEKVKLLERRKLPKCKMGK